MSSHKLDFVDAALSTRQRQQRLRSLIPRQPQLLRFDSNDYLGLSQHPSLKAQAISAVQTYGCGSQGSRLLGGNLSLHEAVEEQLAQLLGREAALLFNTGYQANLSLIPALADRHSELFVDRLAHHSLLQGCLLSRAKLRRFAHNDLEQLQTLLAKSSAKRKLVVTESLFSMDGDYSNSTEISRLCEQHGAILYIDDAHGFGMRKEAALPGPDIHVVTFGKAAGCFGAAVACSQRLKTYFLNAAGGFFYSTALPPAALAAIQASLDLLPGLDELRTGLMARARWLRGELIALGWQVGPSDSHIIPLMLGSDAAALALSGRLAQAGISIAAVRPPTVPEGQARLRIILNATHSETDCQRLVHVLGAA